MQNKLREPVIVFALLVYGANTMASAQVEVSNKKTGSDELTVFKLKQSDSLADFSINEPDKNDINIYLSIPAAFTTTSSSISGAAVCNGKKCGGAANNRLAGTVLYIEGNFEIFKSDRGQVLTKSFLADVQKDGGSLFQQFLLVSTSAAQPFKDKALAPRRALAIFNNGDRAVVQFLKPITMGQFAHDLESIGVREAVYTPVGDADGGWYRKGEKIIKIGKTSSPVPVQSNWAIWKKGSEKRDPKAVDRWLQQHTGK
jgi:hypothetical protein